MWTTKEKWLKTSLIFLYSEFHIYSDIKICSYPLMFSSRPTAEKHLIFLVSVCVSTIVCGKHTNTKYKYKPVRLMYLHLASWWVYQGLGLQDKFEFLLRLSAGGLIFVRPVSLRGHKLLKWDEVLAFLSKLLRGCVLTARCFKSGFYDGRGKHVHVPSADLCSLESGEYNNLALADG